MDKNLDDLISKYKKEFPELSPRAPLLIACELGRIDDVKLLITDKSISVNKVYRYHQNCELTLLMLAAAAEHFQVVKYLIEEGEADPNIANRYGVTALHLAAGWNRTDTGLIQLLLNNMTLDSINKKDRWGDTPLDGAYYNNRSPIRQEIIKLLRSNGGKANYFDDDGNYIDSNNVNINEQVNQLLKF